MFRAIQAACLSAVLFVPVATEAADLITADQAINLAINVDPAIKAAEAGADASTAGFRQAERLPNPTLGVEVENFGGSGSVAGLRSAEYTLAYGQTVELGGDRGARRAMASGNVKLANAQLTVQRLDTAKSVREAYIFALSNEAKLELIRERVRFAQHIVRAVNQRANNGRDSAMAVRQAQANVAQAEADLVQAERNYQQSRMQLASLWNGADDGFVLEKSAFREPANDKGIIPAGEEQSFPDLELYEALSMRASAGIKLEQARALPDPEFSGGIRRFEGTDETAFLVGVSIPFPVLDSNRNNIDRAQSELLQADLSKISAHRKLTQQLAVVTADRDNARIEISTLRANVIPQAEEALSLAKSGYDQGAFSYLEVTDASRNLNAVQERLVEALQRYHISEISIARLTGQDVSAAAAPHP
jgi:cobalt-zinc-cadmium efflux system outer membrane protein